MDHYSLRFEEFAALRPHWRFDLVEDAAALSRLTAEEVTEELKRAEAEDRRLLVICPVGPIDYRWWAEAMNREQVDGARLTAINMDEYLDESGEWVPESHPLSFRRFMREGLLERLEGRARVPWSNLHFPSPHDPAATTRLVEAHGGADLCYGGMGLTGHFAFNDPPEPGEPASVEIVRGSRTRILTISRESQAQMCMGGSGGNWEIIPRTAVTLGMYELLLSRKIHLTFMRSWHAGVLRRALFGPIAPTCPGSFVQEHPNVRATLTRLAAETPLLCVAQRVAA